MCSDQKSYQANGERLLNFTNRFQQFVNILRAVNEVVHYDATMAVDYLEGIDKRIYGEMLRDLKNRDRNNAGVYPTDLASAHNYIKRYSVMIVALAAELFILPTKLSPKR